MTSSQNQNPDITQEEHNVLKALAINQKRIDDTIVHLEGLLVERNSLTEQLDVELPKGLGQET